MNKILLKRLKRSIEKNGLLGLLENKLIDFLSKKKDLKFQEKYQNWIKKIEKPRLEEDRKSYSDEIKNFRIKPKISILMPVYNVDPIVLKEAIESIQNQWYENWELCMYDDKSTSKQTRSFLESYVLDLVKDKPKKYKIKFGESNKNISLATNEAFEMSTGDYLMLMDNDDMIAENCFFEVAKLLNITSQDLIYFYEDLVDDEFTRYIPFIRPNYSPDLLLSIMYPTHAVYSREIFEKSGMLRKLYEGSQDYDLVLRVSEITDKIKLIPKFLYHWRMVVGSTAENTWAKAYAYEVAKKSISESLSRRGIKNFNVENFIYPFEVKFEKERNTDVTVFVDALDNSELLNKTINSLIKIEDINKQNLMIFSQENIEEIKCIKTDKDRILSDMERVMEKVNSEWILFTKSGVDIKNNDLISQVAGWSQFEDINILGGKILYPKKLFKLKDIKSSGVLVDEKGKRLIGKDQVYYEWQTNMVRTSTIANFIAMDREFMLVRTDFLKSVDIQKMDYENYDLELGIQSMKSEKRNVYIPYFEVFLMKDYKDNTKLKYNLDNFDISKDPYYSPIVTEINEAYKEVG